jgi:hypothetical protein
MRTAVFLSGAFYLFMLNACVMPPRQPIDAPIVPNFTFNPPGVPPASRSDMTIAIIKPLTEGNMFSRLVMASENPYVAANTDQTQVYLDEMLDAAKTDIEKILVTKGFNTLGPFDTIDEMTYSEKERSSLILAPTFDISMDLQGLEAKQTRRAFSQEGTVLVRGNVILAFLEPMTREKVWLKRLDLEPFAAPYSYTVRTRPVTPGEVVAGALLNRPLPRNQSTQNEAAVTTLNSFYQAAMSKIWDHLDPREIKG